MHSLRLQLKDLPSVGTFHRNCIGSYMRTRIIYTLRFSITLCNFFYSNLSLYSQLKIQSPIERLTHTAYASFAAVLSSAVSKVSLCSRICPWSFSSSSSGWRCEWVWAGGFSRGQSRPLPICPRSCDTGVTISYCHRCRCAQNSPTISRANCTRPWRGTLIGTCCNY